MQTKIHPKYYDDAKVSCRACGTSFTTGSIVENILVEVCNTCHPFYTGEQRFMDTQGRVEKFQKQQERAKKMQAQLAQKKEKAQKEKKSKSLRELLGDI
jgi:large subunit ribosomal protein L31